MTVRYLPRISTLFLIAVPAAVYYEPESDELVEDEEFLLKDETHPEDDDDSDVPVRLLENFTVYDSATMEVIHLAQLLMLEYSNAKYGASGLVKPWVDPDSEVDEVDEDVDSRAEDCEEQLCLSNILEFCVHNMLEGQRFLDA